MGYCLAAEGLGKKVIQAIGKHLLYVYLQIYVTQSLIILVS